jgi:lipopolysaccharide biosynthesis glycosyltransferase
MSQPMHVVFCVDRGVLPGLHVAAYSLLDRINPAVPQTHFTIFSNALNEGDAGLLRQTLAALGRPFTLELRRLNLAGLNGFPPLNGSLAAYYRLLATQFMEVDRFLYLDADTVCDLDVSVLQTLELGHIPAAWVPEAPLAGAVDRRLADQLGNRADEPYFNSGVILVNVPEWRRQQISEKAMAYVARHQPEYHDQSALNYVLYRNAHVLDSKFNCLTNQRHNWPALVPGYGRIGRLVHFLDSPKPWNFLSEWVHPQYRLWRTVLDRTALKGYRSWTPAPARKFPRTRKALAGYRKIFKDRLLFSGYAHGRLKHVKGVPGNARTEMGGAQS